MFQIVFTLLFWNVCFVLEKCIIHSVVVLLFYLYFVKFHFHVLNYVTEGCGLEATLKPKAADV